MLFVNSSPFHHDPFGYNPNDVSLEVENSYCKQYFVYCFQNLLFILLCLFYFNYLFYFAITSNTRVNLTAELAVAEAPALPATVRRSANTSDRRNGRAHERRRVGRKQRRHVRRAHG